MVRSMPTFRAQPLDSTPASRPVAIAEPMFSFGRSSENALTIEMPQASRVHGHIYHEDGQWYCINQSANGTTINGRRIGKKPQPLKDGDVIGVGKTPMFKAALAEPAPPADDESPAEPQADAESPVQRLTPEQVDARKRMRLWVGIAIYLIVALVAIIVISQLRGDGEDGQAQAAEQLTRQEIVAEITEPIDRPTYERDARQWLDKARSLFQRREAHRRNLYDAYVAYKEALAYSGQSMFEDGLVHREFKACEEELIDRVTQTYREAYALLRSRQYQAAEQKFRSLVQEIYPDKDSRLYRNANAQLAVARRNMPR